MCTIFYIFVVVKDSRERERKTERWRDRKREGKRERKRILFSPREEFLSDYTLLSGWVNSEIKYTEATVNIVGRLYLYIYEFIYKYI